MGVKIVVIDDDKPTLAMLEKTLIMRGFWVYGAKDGAAGLELIQKEKPDLVISDIVLPVVDGLEICRQVKESPELQDVKIIMVSGIYKGSFGKEEAISSGADEFINKPIDMNFLLTRIFELLNIDEEFNKKHVKVKSGDDEE